MGGKTKQTQRTKNNVRPSSSGRSAELLYNVKLDSSAMVVTSGGKTLPALFPTMASASLDYSLNPEFALCIKKLNKKDPITRQKALQELTMLVKKGNVEDVLAILPSWVNMYKILSVDIDHKVRESAQICHGAICASSGRQLAGSLRGLVPAWLAAQHDDYAPAAFAARQALMHTFPENKLPEVITFCKSEIMTYLLDNIVGDVESAINKKLETEEEKELQRSRIVRSNLNGLEVVCRWAVGEQRGWLWSHLMPLLQHRRYWALPLHTDPLTRGAWFALNAAVVEVFGEQFGEQFGQRMVRLVLAAANERAPPVAARLWACLLAFAQHVKDWHKWIDDMDLLKKRILVLLENGAWGEARRCGALLLPLLALLPPFHLTDHFYQTLFSAWLTGLEHPNVMSSKSEREGWVQSMAECLRWASERGADVAAALRAWARAALAPRAPPAPHGTSPRARGALPALAPVCARHMRALLLHWLQRPEPTYQHLVRNFWHNLTSTLLEQIDSLPEDADCDAAPDLVDRHTLFLKSLKNGEVAKSKIKFEDEEPAEGVEAVEGTEAIEASVAASYDHQVQEAAARVVARHLQWAGRARSRAVLPHVVTLLATLDGTPLYASLPLHLELPDAYSIYDKMYREWVCDEGLRCRAALAAAFLLLPRLPPTHQRALFASFDQFPPSVVEWGISLSLSESGSAWESAREWLRGELVAATLAGAAQRLRCPDPPAEELLLAVLRDGDELIGCASGERVVSVLREILAEGVPAGEGARRVAAVVAPVLARGCGAHLPLVLDLFRLDVQGEAGCDAWRRCASGAALRAAAPALLRAALCSDELNIETIEHLTSLCPPLLTGEEAPGVAEPLVEIITFTEHLFSFDKSVDVPVEVFALTRDCIEGNLNCPFEDDNDIIKTVIQNCDKDDVCELTKVNLVNFVSECLFRVSYLRTVFAERGGDEEVWCNNMLRDEFFRMELCKALHDHAIISSLYDGYTFWPYYDVIEKAKLHQDKLIDDIIDMTSVEMRGEVASTLTELSLNKGYYWAYATRHYRDKVTAGNETEADDLAAVYLGEFEKIVTGSGYIHTLQVARRRDGQGPSEAVLRLALCARAALAASLAGAGTLAAAALRPACVPLRELAYAHYESDSGLLLLEGVVPAASWAHVVANAEAMHVISAALVDGHLNPDQWDFVNITVCSLLATLAEHRSAWGTTKVSMLLCVACRVAAQLSVVPREYNARLEWNRVFQPDLTRALGHLLEHVLQSAEAATCARVVVLRALQAAGVDGAIGVIDDGLARVAVAALRRAAGADQLRLAYATLHSCLPKLAQQDEEKLQNWSSEENEDEEGIGEMRDGEEEESEKGGVVLAAELFDEPLRHLHRLLEAALDDLTGGELCQLAPHTDGFGAALAYLLLSAAQLQLADLARDDLVLQYVHMFRNTVHLGGLMSCALRLLPPEADTAADLAHLFQRGPPLTPGGPARSAEVAALACRCVFLALGGCGAGAVRGWWAATGAHGKRLRTLVHRHVAPALVNAQLAALRAPGAAAPGAVLRARLGAREAECEMRVEEREVRLCVRMSDTHPLEPPHVPPVPPPSPPTRGLALLLAQRNGSVVEALRLWCEAVTRRVRRAPLCCVCYCRLQPSCGRLPRTSCPTCNNKFHHECLRKWFTTSGKSHCPICRGAF